MHSDPYKVADISHKGLQLVNIPVVATPSLDLCLICEYNPDHVHAKHCAVQRAYWQGTRMTCRLPEPRHNGEMNAYVLTEHILVAAESHRKSASSLTHSAAQAGRCHS